MKKGLSKIILTVLVFVSRLGFLPPNFSPLGSFGFFGKNIFLYFGLIFVFDLTIGGLYAGIGFTYLGFLAYYLMGRVAKNKIGRQVLLLPIASLLFFIFSNFGSFLTMYPQTIEGLMQCYTMALPFFQNTFLSDLTFGYGFLAVFQFAKHFYPNFFIQKTVVK